MRVAAGVDGRAASHRFIIGDDGASDADVLYAPKPKLA
jgi:hypothetical protein